MEITLVDGDVSVTIGFDPPPGWTVASTDGRLVLATPGGSWLRLRLTCHGECGDRARARANVEQVARETFAFVQSDRHVPRLVPVWDRPVSETAPGVLQWAFHGASDDGSGYEEHHAAVDHLVDTPTGVHLVHCKIELSRHDVGQLDDLVRGCVALGRA